MPSRTAHQRAVRVARTLGVPVRRAYPDHPSTKRVLKMFEEQNRRKDAELRRLPDLFRECVPISPGYSWRYTPKGHRCSSLSAAMVGGKQHTVLVCKHHSRTPLSAERVGIGVDWLRSFVPAEYAAWRTRAYTQAAVVARAYNSYRKQQHVPPPAPAFVRCKTHLVQV